jgi:hypothetical protein
MVVISKWELTMSNNKIKSLRLKMRMKYYPFLPIEGIFLELSENTLTVLVHEKYKNDIEMYLPKTLSLFLEKDEEMLLFGNVNPVDITPKGNFLMVKLIATDVKIQPLLLENLKKMNIIKLSQLLPGKLYMS